MKIGIEKNDGYNRFGADAYKKMREHGYECLDYGTAGDNSWVYTSDEDEFVKKVSEEKALMEKAGVMVSQVHGPWRYPPRDETPEDVADRMARMKKSIRFTSMMGAKNWVIHPIMPYGLEDKGTELEQKTWDANIAFMSELVKTAREYDVTICFENMPFKNFSISTPSDIMRVVKAIDDDHFRVCIDTGHVNIFEDLTPGNAVRECGEYLAALHVHDNNGIGDQHKTPYFGTIDWEDFGNALKEVGFEGVFSFETVIPKNIPSPAFEEMNKSLVCLARTIVDRA